MTEEYMHFVRISDLSSYAGHDVEIRGWLYNKRSSGRIKFLIVRDGSGVVQVILERKNVGDDIFDLVDSLTQETSLIIGGTVRDDARAPGGYELILSDIEVVQIADTYPITPKEHGIAFLLDHRHLWLRSRRQQAILKIRGEVVRGCRDFFDERGFLLIDAPIFTPSSCEGTSNLFETDYFGEKAYLSQSGQLYMEAAAFAFGKVYFFGPTFRAEKSKTRRHLTEFWMIEPEVAYAVLEDIMDLAEDFLIYLVERVLERKLKELEVLERDTAPLENVQKPFPRLRYDKAVDMLHEDNIPFVRGEDFGGDEETVISKKFDRPLMIHHYPRNCKAFYMKPDPDDPRYSLGVDILAHEGYGEIIGGGQRSDDFTHLIEGIQQFELNRDDFEWYLDLRRYGTAPHSGFGMGIERFLAWICGIHHLRETIPFPRLINRLRP
jgi:asparaginyl-tRNA synthetase